MFGNFSAQAGVLGTSFLSSPNIIRPTVTWNFNNVLTFGFNSTVNNVDNSSHRPRINVFRSANGQPDFSYILFLSGGQDVLLPAPSGKVYQPWGDRRTGTFTFPITSISDNDIAGIDVFTHTFAPVKTGTLSPPFNSGWTISTDPNIPGEIKYQYQFKIGEKTPQINVELDYLPTCVSNGSTVTTDCTATQNLVFVGTSQDGCPIFRCEDSQIFSEVGSLYTPQDWFGFGKGGFGSWFFTSGTGSVRNIESSTQLGRRDIGKSFLVLGSNTSTNASVVDFNLVNSAFETPDGTLFNSRRLMTSGSTLSVDVNYAWNGGERQVIFRGFYNSDYQYRFKHGGFGLSDAIRYDRNPISGTTNSTITNSGVIPNAFLSGFTYKVTHLGTGFQMRVFPYRRTVPIYSDTVNALSGVDLRDIDWTLFITGLRFIGSGIPGVDTDIWPNYGMYFNNIELVDPNTWNIGINIPYPGASFSMYVNGRGNFNIDWGDGDSERLSTSEFSLEIFRHIYDAPGFYTIKFNGAFEPGGTFGQIRFLSTDSFVSSNEFKTDYVISTSVIPTIPGLQEVSFELCRNLESIPSGLFSNNPSLKRGSIVPGRGMFEGCRSLKSIPANLFEKFPSNANIDNCFLGCTSLETVPNGLLDPLKDTTEFYRVFAGCTSLKEVGGNLLFFNTGASGSRGFDLFTSLENSTTYPFSIDTVELLTTSYSELLVSLASNINQRRPNVLFNAGGSKYNSAGQVARQLLIDTKGWTFLDSGLDRNLSFNNWNLEINTTGSNQTFGIFLSGTSPSINVNWGDGFIESFITTGNKTHNYVTGGNYVVRIGGNFSIINNDGNIRIGTTTDEKSRLTSIIGLSRISGCNNFFETFKDCSSLKMLPENLFSSNPNISNFENCFQGCTSLTRVHNKVFNNIINANNFRNCFSGVTLTTRSYSNLLRTLAVNANQRPNGVPFGGGNSKYSLAGQQARQILQNKGWIFNDSGFDNTFSNETWDLNFKGAAFQLLVNGKNPEITVDLGNEDLDMIFFPTVTRKPYQKFITGENVIRIEGVFESSGNIKLFSDNIYNKFTKTSVIPFISGLSNFNETFTGLSFESLPPDLFSKNPQVTGFNQTFYGCKNLTGIPSGIFGNNPNVQEFTKTFNECSSLVSIPSGLFSGNRNVKSFTRTFNKCFSLKSIPSGLFANNTGVTSFNSTFEYCLFLQSIGPGIFNNNINVTNFDRTFEQCPRLEFLPERLFDNNINATSFRRTFYTCVGLTGVPSGIFQNNLNVNNYDYVFGNIAMDSQSYSNLLQNLANNASQRLNNVAFRATNFGIINFYYDHELPDTSPNMAFTDSNRNVVNVDLPATRYNSSALSAVQTLVSKGWSGISGHIGHFYDPRFFYMVYTGGQDVFDFTNPLLLTLGGSNINLYVDWGDGSLPVTYTTPGLKTKPYTMLPTGVEIRISGVLGNNGSFSLLQAGNSQKGLTAFSPLPFISGLRNFRLGNRDIIGVERLAVLPGDLFINNPQIDNFNSAFWGVGLYSIPRNLFSFCTGVTGFEQTFRDCLNLNILPENTFINNTEARSFNFTFANSKELDFVPSGLFRNNFKVTGFYGTFANKMQFGDGYEGGDPNAIYVRRPENFTLYDKTFESRLNQIPKLVIESGLFNNNTGVLDFSATFANRGIEKLPSGLFDKNIYCRNFQQLFSSNMFKSIPSGLFDKNIHVTSFQGTFQNCLNLKNITPGLFKNNTHVNTFQKCFDIDNMFLNNYNPNIQVFTPSLMIIPEDLFINNTGVTNFNYTFQGQPFLIDIPSGLFKNNLIATDFGLCFDTRALRFETRSSSLLSLNPNFLPDNLFINNLSGFNFEYVNAPSLAKFENIVNNMALNYTSRVEFAYLASISQLTQAFEGQNSINLLKQRGWRFNLDTVYVGPNWSPSYPLYFNPYNAFTITIEPNVGPFASVYGIEIKGINPDISVIWNTGNIIPSKQERYTETGFYSGIYVQSFPKTIYISGSFADSGSLRLVEVPNQNVAKLTTVSLSRIPFMPGLKQISFANTRISGVPADIFAFNPQIENFESCFENTQLTHIPRKLFSKQSKATNFSRCFFNCTALSNQKTSDFYSGINTDLFITNFSGNNFFQCFQNTTLDTEFYSNILINLAEYSENRPSNITFDGGRSKYNVRAMEAVEKLKAKGWNIIDSGLL